MKLIINDPNKDTSSTKIIKGDFKTILVVSNEDILNFKKESTLFLRGTDIDLIFIPKMLEDYFKSDICELRKFLQVHTRRFIYF